MVILLWNISFLELYTLKIDICRRWSCLLNKPRHDNLGQLRTTVRETFTMDEQCRMEFGEGWVSYVDELHVLYTNNDIFYYPQFDIQRSFLILLLNFISFALEVYHSNLYSWMKSYEHCKTFDIEEPCSRLWCGNSNISESCKTKKGPPLEGTLCGTSKV